MNVYKIVLTGGPCAGKTQILESISKDLKQEGYYVIIVPETASEYIRNNVIPNGSDRELTLIFQDLMLQTQYIKEKSSENYANFIKDKHDVIILYDRAIMDNRAYLSQSDYDNLLKKYNINELEFVDKYDLVIDLISTATAKPECYELNDTRSESIELASERDKLTSLAWLLHRNLKVIKPTEKLEEKKYIVLDYIRKLLNNKQNNEFVIMELDKDNLCYDYFNENNSKNVHFKKIYLKNLETSDYQSILIERRYKEHVSYILEKVTENQIISSIPIKQEDCINLISLHGIENIENLDVLSFVDNGNYFKIVNQDSYVHLETEFKNIPYIPDYIPFKTEKSKTLIKQKYVVR